MTSAPPSSDLAPAALPRPIDFAYPSNRWAVAGLLGGVVLSRLRGRSWVGSVGTGLSGFAAWAIARELDPDHTQSANVALPLALATSLLSDDQSDAAAMGDVLAAFTALSSTRVLSATVGQAANAGDQAALGAAAAMCAGAGQRAAALLPGAALALSSRQADALTPRRRQGRQGVQIELARPGLADHFGRQAQAGAVLAEGFVEGVGEFAGIGQRHPHRAAPQFSHECVGKAEAIAPQSEKLCDDVRGVLVVVRAGQCPADGPDGFLNQRGRELGIEGLGRADIEGHADILAVVSVCGCGPFAARH